MKAYTTIRISSEDRDLIRDLSKATGLTTPNVITQALRLMTACEVENCHVLTDKEYQEFITNNNWKGKFLMRDLHREHMAELLAQVVAEIGTQLAMMRAATEGIKLVEPTEQAIKAESDQIQQEIEQYVADNVPDDHD